MGAEKVIDMNNRAVPKLAAGLAAVCAARRFHLEIHTSFYVACVTVPRTETLVIGHGVVWLPIVQAMCACLSAETDIRSCTDAVNG